MVDPRPAEWILPEPAQPERELLAAFAGNPVFAEVLHRRGYTHLADAMAFLDETRYTPSDPFDFPDMLPAAQMVLRHIHNGNRIAVCGDYDTDGLTATAILYEGLSALSPRVQFQIPDRGRSAHGISEIAVRELHTLGVELILTCDTGVSEHEALALARSLGMDVIITDHHTQPDPPAPAHHIINPVVLPPDHRMVSLSGAGVAYQFLRGVYRLAGIEERCGDFLDLAAIGLIGDLVPLTGDARWLVQCGVKALQTSRRPGIAEILRCAGIPPEQATEKTISHTLAPRINSLSRMMDAGLVIDLLTTRDAKRAGEMAPLAEQANSSRKQLSDTILMAAAAAVENDRTMLDKPLLYLESSQWHHSVLGVVANQLAERYNRPTVIVSSFDLTTARGSARSVPGMDITAVIARNADHLDRYGGHAMAAGFSIRKDRLPDFKRALMATAGQFAAQNESRPPQITIDAVLPLWLINQPGFSEILHQFRPFGPGNPPLQLLAENLRFLESVPFGKNQNHRRISCSTQTLSRHSLLWWNSVDLSHIPEQFDVVYQLQPSRADRPADLQIHVTAIRAHEQTDTPAHSRAPAVEVVDWRDAADTPQVIRQRLATRRCAVFAEGLPPLPGITSCSRLEISPCDELVLLTYPPGYAVLRGILTSATPKRVMVIGMPSPLDQKTALMQIITETILAAIRSADGRVNIPSLAARTGQTERNIRLAIDWLAKKTTLRIREKAGPDIILDRLGSPSDTGHEDLEDLEKALEETLAFRRVFHKADLSALFLNLETGQPGGV